MNDLYNYYISITSTIEFDDLELKPLTYDEFVLCARVLENYPHLNKHEFAHLVNVNPYALTYWFRNDPSYKEAIAKLQLNDWIAS